MSRRIVFDDVQCEAELIQVLSRFGFTPDETVHIVKIVCADEPFSAAVDTHLHELVKVMFQYTWISVEGVTNLNHTKTGSCAGTPVGDF
eukprot:8824587-Karenia_brevis.AAC.1